MSNVYIRLAVPDAVIAAAAEIERSAALVRVPLLETLLARADVAEETLPWRHAALRTLGIVDVIPAAGMVQALRLGAVTEPWVMLATPLHMTAGHSGVQLDVDGVLRLSRSDAQTLAMDFNATFADDALRMAATHGASEDESQLLCLCAAEFDVATRDPMDARGSDLWGFQPSGTDAMRLRRLMSEIELWLFDHAVNRERAARGAVPITGLWLWAGAASMATAPIAQGFTGGADPILSAIDPWPALPHTQGSGVVVFESMPGGAQWSCATDRWLAPAVVALRSRRFALLQLSIGRRCFSVRASSWRRIWRRQRAWWEYLQHE